MASLYLNSCDRCRLLKIRSSRKAADSKHPSALARSATRPINWLITDHEQRKRSAVRGDPIDV